MEFYKSGFELKGKLGNNEFSLDERTIKVLKVPKLKKVDAFSNLTEGETAFCELDEGIEFNCKGLNEFQFFKYENKLVYIFDNHNHCFFFTAYEQEKNNYKNLKIIHIDQHKDMRKPDMSFETFKNLSISERESIIEHNTIEFESSYDNRNSFFDMAYEYGNIVLNVGNYIVPLLESNIVSEVYIVDSLSTLRRVDKEAYGDYFLNIDLDFFSKDMDYILFEEKVEIIKKTMKNAKFVTISTSPYFVDLSRCTTALNAIFR